MRVTAWVPNDGEPRDATRKPIVVEPFNGHEPFMHSVVTVHLVVKPRSSYFESGVAQAAMHRPSGSGELTLGKNEK
jgi:hypothetical protein